MIDQNSEPKRSLNRRQFINKTAGYVAGAGAALTAGSLLIPPENSQASQYSEIPTQKPAIPDFNPDSRFFNEHQYLTVATLAALIIPTDEHPGATEAGIVDYLDAFLADGPQQMRTTYSQGLAWIDELSRQRRGRDFIQLDLQTQIDLMQEMHEISEMRQRKVSGFLQRLSRKVDKLRDNVLGMGENAKFFKRLRNHVFNGYVTNPVSWNMIGYYGPPQPVGYLDFADPPTAYNYSPPVRHVNSASCLGCHEATMDHPNGGLIDHACTTCHRPHTPWLRNQDAFHLENHIGVAFPNSDRKVKGGD